jgi:hypothetical protein
MICFEQVMTSFSAEPGTVCIISVTVDTCCEHTCTVINPARVVGRTATDVIPFTGTRVMVPVEESAHVPLPVMLNMAVSVESMTTLLYKSHIDTVTVVVLNPSATTWTGVFCMVIFTGMPATVVTVLLLPVNSGLATVIVDTPVTVPARYLIVAVPVVAFTGFCPSKLPFCEPPSVNVTRLDAV